MSKEEKLSTEQLNELNNQLYEYSYSNNLKQVEECISKGANVNYANINGSTALIWASWNGHIDVAILLLLNGANVPEEGDQVNKMTRLNNWLQPRFKEEINHRCEIKENCRQFLYDLKGFVGIMPTVLLDMILNDYLYDNSELRMNLNLIKRLAKIYEKH